MDETARKHYTGIALEDIIKELVRAQRKHGDFPSLHHGAFALLEEWEELKAEVMKQDKHYAAMYREATQVAAMALKIMVKICEEGGAYVQGRDPSAAKKD